MFLSITNVVNGTNKNLKDIKQLQIIKDPFIYCTLHAFGQKHKLPIYGHVCLEISCNELVFVGGPFCVKHTLVFYQVESKQTSLKLHESCLPFQGLFACRNFKKDIPYFHKCIFVPTCKCQEFVPDPYSISIGSKDHSALQYRCAGSLANTILGRAKRDALGRKVAKSIKDKCNAKFFVSEKMDVNIVANKDIKMGDEIFVYYGKNRTEFLDIYIENLFGM